MIRTDRKCGGTSVKFMSNGSPVDDLEELTAVIKTFRRVWYDVFDKEVADRLIATAGQIAYADSEDDCDSIIKELYDSLNEYEKGGDRS